jgi:DegV family protein with EDD domain
MVEDLETLKRGGRIPASAAVAGAKLDVKPLLTLDENGGLRVAGIARGRKKGIKQLATYFEKNGDSSLPGQCVIVGDADCKKENDRLRDTLCKQNESLITVQSNVGPVIGSHVGPGMLAVCFWGDDRRDHMSISDRIAKKVKAGKE